MLAKLEGFGILNYHPRKVNPQITFLTPRFDGKNISLSDENYKDRFTDSKKRMEAIVGYLKNDTKCRSRQLLGYFGEEIAHRCGKCDVCIERNKVELSEYEFDRIVDQIKPMLKENPYHLKDLAGSLKQTSQDNITKVVQWLLDNDKVTYTNEKKLKWNE